MAEGDRYHSKRPRDPDDDDHYSAAGGRPSKNVRVEEFLESTDPAVRIKLRSMFDDRLLMTSDLDEHNITELSKFDASTALEILEHYCSGDLSAVRNRRAYLAGAIRRRAHMVTAQRDVPLSSDGPILAPDVQHRLEQIKQESAKAGELDQRCIDALAAMPPSRALAALDKFGCKDFNAVRNPSALFMAMVRQVMEADEHEHYHSWDHHRHPPPRHPDDRHWDHHRSDWDRGGRGPGRPDYGGYMGGGPPPEYDYHHEYHHDDSYGHPPPRHHHHYDGGHQRPPPPPRQQLPPPMVVVGGGPPSAPQQQLLQLPPGLAGLPPGTTLMQGPNGTLVLAAAPGPAVLGGMPAGVPGLVLAQAPVSSGALPQLMVLSAGAAAAAPQAGMLAAPVAAPAAAAAGGAVLQLQQQPPLPQQQQGLGLGVAPPPAAAGAPQQAPPPPVLTPQWAARHRHYGAEQGQLGVRIAEFHDLSPFAAYVQPSTALKLQNLWDGGNELLSMFDDRSWQVLAEMPAPEALAVIQQAADALDDPAVQIRNLNPFFASLVRKVWPQWVTSCIQHLSKGASKAGRGGGRAGGGGAGYQHHSRGGGQGDWGSGASSAGADAGGYSDKPPQFSRQPVMHLLPAEQRGLAEELCRAHAPLLRPEHFDEGVIDHLARLSHEDGKAVLNELGMNDFLGVRNMPGYIMGICKRYQRGQGGQQHQPRSVQ